MPNKGIKNKHKLILVFAILLFSLALMTLSAKQEKGTHFLDSVAGVILSPFQNFFTQTLQPISDGINHYFFLVDVARENDQLNLEVQRLINEKNKLIERIASQKRLAKLMAYEDDWEKKAVVASVIGKGATQWSKVIIINKGTQHGIRDHLAVVTDAGVIGQIIHAGLNTSKVLLIIDGRSAVDALFQESRISGVVVGGGDDECHLKFVPNTADVKVGDKVLSSGLGGIFPKGLIIGKVSQVIKKKQGLFQDITLVPSSDLSRLEEVLVLLS
ncbi:MAG: rod shape-determining protein MreC [Nitrospina sp.]|nr:rod shape-determining protein MreC [Nitrospina sp.]